MAETFKYKLEAMECPIKEEPKELTFRLGECLSEICNIASTDKVDPNSYYTVKSDGNIFHVPQEDILCFRTAGEIHRITLYAKDRILEFRGTLSEIESEMGADFLDEEQPQEEYLTEMYIPVNE